MNQSWLRFIDIAFAGLFFLLLLPCLLILVLLGWYWMQSPIFIQERVGQFQRPFRLYKFRTMNLNTESVATHLVDSKNITSFGRFLRKTKLDELPQLINVLKGEMSFVGPRPCLFNQERLREERDALGVFNVRPGITGLAQVNGVDMSEPKRLAKLDRQMMDSFTLSHYFLYLLQTVMGKGQGDRVQK